MKKFGKIALIVFAIILGVAYFAEGGVEDTLVENQMQKTYNKVTKDAIEQYNIVKKTGDAIQAYTQAEMVAQAFLQAKDEENYNKWKKIAEEWKKKAGM